MIVRFAIAAVLLLSFAACAHAQEVPQLRADSTRAAPQVIYVERAPDPLTRTLAWLGVALSVLTLGWNILLRALSGPWVRVRAQSDMALGGLGVSEEVAAYVFVTFQATNDGDRPTTISAPYLLWFENWWDDVLWRVRELLGLKPAAKQGSARQTFFLNPQTAQPLPFRMEPGTVWHGRITQDLALVGLMTRGRLYVCIYHSAATWPARVRLQRQAQVPLAELMPDPGSLTPRL